jgi:AcrR family transcriptional regulator
VGRPAKYSSDDILDTTARLVAQGGPGLATVAAIAAQLHAPSGSIYHRFASRDLLVAHLWVRTVREAQEGFVAALGLDDVEEAAVAASLHIPRWSRDNLDKARVLVLHRREDLVERWPEELGDQLAGLNTGIGEALDAYTVRRFDTNSQRARRAVAFALVDVPYGAVRRYLHAGQPPPRAIDDLIRRACECTLQSV